MARLLPPLNALKAFEAAGRHESFSRAAEELNVSHSAISRHVRGLEDNLGASLFRDLPRGVELTLEGHALLTRITAALDEVAAATEMARQQPQGVITVSCEPLFAQKFLIPRLSGFYAAFPQIELRIEASRALVDVARHEADLAIRFAHQGSLSVPSDLLSDAPLYPYAAPTLCPGGWSDPAQLLGHRLYRDRSGDLWPQWAGLAGIALPDGHSGAWRMETGLALEATLHGQGVFLGSQDCVLDDLRAGRLIRCFPIGFRDGCFRLVLGAGSARRKSINAFRGWLLDETALLRGMPIDGNDQPFG
ncbi:LysR substrate-binding domain-containing protein [Ruegeria meonggei]|uniref:Glycine cleavage system transcriptional activator n=1 Tax=Ruegeria meonggei TaxID=1446476 RepID=A0A1X7AAP8_9RHOB|nr:LysR substrate-binding domain-containing protein [Ruegeria meonggei]SLN74147.1 Glycine cleavage system transcriptional activator [Ruegeria meonggei]